MWLKVLVAIILIAMIIPILIIIPLSFTSVGFIQFPPPGYSTRWYVSFFNNQDWINSLVRSLFVAFSTSIVALIVGTMAAVAVMRLNFVGKKAFMALMVAPMVIPVIIVAISLYHSFSNLKLINSLLGLILSHSILAIPIVFVLLMASLKGIDRNYELAAMSLGSNPTGAFFKITLPMVMPAVLSAGLFSFITSLDELVVTIFISGANTKTLPIVMWENLRVQVDPTMASASTLLIVGILVLFLLQSSLSFVFSKKKNLNESA
jgi:putative spermidine/putrescine transport system permease protein